MIEYLVLVMFLARVEMFVFLQESAADLVSKALLQLTTAHKVLNHMVYRGNFNKKIKQFQCLL